MIADHRKTVAWVAMACCCAFAPFAAAQEGADWVPVETETYIEVNHAASLATEIEQDPRLKALIEPALSIHDSGKTFRELETTLGLTPRQFLERYFGERLVLAAPAEPKECVAISRVVEADANHAVTKLGLQPLADIPPFKVYKMVDGHARVAFGAGLMVLGPGRDEDAGFFNRVVGGIQQPGGKLASDEVFRSWTVRLPGDAAAFLLHRDPKKGETHAATVHYSGGDVVLEYAGDSVGIRAMVARRSDAGASDFGPVPDSALLGAALNISAVEKGSKLSQKLDELLAPQSFSEAILPKLASPWIVAVVETECPNRADGEPEQLIPGVMVGVKLRDVSVSAELDGVMKRFCDAFNARLVANGFDPVDVVAIGEGDFSYHVLDIGGAVSRWFHTPELAPLARMTYGRVGDWYVVATQEDLFLQSRKVEAGQTTSWIGPSGEPGVRFGPREGWIGVARLRGDRAGYHLGVGLNSPQFMFMDAEGVRAMRFVSQVLRESGHVGMEWWEEDGALRVRAQLTRKEPPAPTQP